VHLKNSLASMHRSVAINCDRRISAATVSVSFVSDGFAAHRRSGFSI